MRTDKQVPHPPFTPAPPVAHAGEGFGISPEAVRESFQLWLQEVASGPRVRRTARALTPGELTAVSLATVRESSKHRRWPREIVERFLAAEIVTCPLATHTPAARLYASARRINFLWARGEG